MGENFKHYTAEELRSFDGKVGHPLYIQFKGKVYDLTESQLWIEGSHMDLHVYSENLTETIKDAPHGEEMLDRFPVIGEVAEQENEERAQPEAKNPSLEEKQLMPEQPAAKSGLDRRNFLKLVSVLGGVATAGAALNSLKILGFIPQTSTQLAWPKVKVANLSQLQDLTPVTFYYPLTNTPNLLVKLGAKADGGVGPSGDVVAFSGVCQHLGCFYSFIKPGDAPTCNPSFHASTPEGYCCCHGSQYDFVHGAAVISGPAPRPVPQVQLQYDQGTGDIYAVAMGAPTIFNHGPAGTADPSMVLFYDLQGGSVVPGGS